MSLRNFEIYRKQVLDLLSQEYVPSEIRNFETWRFKVLEGLSAEPESLGTSIRQEKVYREEVLKALGVDDYTTDDIAYEDNWKEKVLEALGQEYTTEDLVNFEKWREKVLNGLDEYYGGVYKTVSGMIVSIVDAKEAPIKSLVAQIVPKQSGSGDPSPDNVRPISGWSGVEVNRTRKNLFNPKPYSGVGYNPTIGTEVNLIESDVEVTETNTGYSFPVVASWRMTNFRTPTLKAGRYNVNIQSESANSRMSAYRVGTDGTVKGSYNATGTTALSTYFIVEDGEHICCSIGANAVVTQAFTPIIELGSTATDYEPYQGTSKSIPFKDSQGNPITVYGGEIDVVSGLLKSYPFYPSYNGETLSGEWICDRAVYSQGTTPPIGSQVVDMSGNGTEYQLEPTEIKTLKGNNNIWADTGDVEVTYKAEKGGRT